MSTQIEIAKVVNGFKFALVETFEEVRGMYLDKGMSLFETVDALTAEEASRPITQDCATIAAHVAHTRFYLDVMYKALLEKSWQTDADWDEIWRTTSVVTPEEWEVIRTMLRESYDRVLKELENYESWEGEVELSSILCIVVHSAYHLGEIQQATCFIKYLKAQDAAQDAG